MLSTTLWHLKASHAPTVRSRKSNPLHWTFPEGNDPADLNYDLSDLNYLAFFFPPLHFSPRLGPALDMFIQVPMSPLSVPRTHSDLVETSNAAKMLWKCCYQKLILGLIAPCLWCQSRREALGLITEYLCCFVWGSNIWCEHNPAVLFISPGWGTSII